METFTVTTGSGKTFSVRLKDIQLNDPYKILGSRGGWEKRAEIQVDETWYPCNASHSNQRGGMVMTVKISEYQKDTMEALNVPVQHRKNDIHIMADNDWHPIYNKMLDKAEASWKGKANSLPFTELSFMYHTSHKFMGFRTDNEELNDLIEYSERINKIQEALKFVKTDDLENYRTGFDMGDYSHEYYFTIPENEIDQVIAPGIEKSVIAKAERESFNKAAEDRRINIENGAVYFNCESAPHDEDLSGVLLNRPAPNGGSFTLTHRIDKPVFSRIAKYGRYYDREMLEDFDMFYHDPGWRFSIKALEELEKDLDVYVNGKEYLNEG